MHSRTPSGGQPPSSGSSTDQGLNLGVGTIGTGSKIMSPLRTSSVARLPSAQLPAHPSAWSSSRNPPPPAQPALYGDDRSSTVSSQLSDISTSDEEATASARLPVDVGGIGPTGPSKGGRAASVRRSLLLPPSALPQPPPKSRSSSQSGRAPSAGANTPLLTPRVDGLPRLSRAQSTSRYPSIGGVGPAGGSTSRSASRARAREREEDDVDQDDEIAVRDRGEDLIRKRMKERKRAKRIAGRFAASSTGAEGSTDGQIAQGYTSEGTQTGKSAPATPGLDNRGPQNIPDEIVLGGRSRAASRTREGHGQGRGQERNRDSSVTGYFPRYEEVFPPHSEAIGYLTTANLSEHDQQTADEEHAPSTGEGMVTPPSKRPDRASSIVSEVVEEVVREAEEGRENEEDVDEDESESDESPGDADEEGVTLRDRQDAINIEHPFGLPIWKPALYKKSRSITRNAETALHAIPSAAAERHLLPGNILWTLVFGWWLSLFCFLAAVIVLLGEKVGGGNAEYSRTLFGLGWYIGWPFGKYVSGDGEPKKKGKPSDAQAQRDALEDNGTVAVERLRLPSDSTESIRTVREIRTPGAEDGDAPVEISTGSSPGLEAALVNVKDYGDLGQKQGDERQGLLRNTTGTTYGATESNGKPSSSTNFADSDGTAVACDDADSPPRNQVLARVLGALLYWPVLFILVAPVMLCVCILCWGMVITIPMAKLNWALLKILVMRPLEIHFKSAPKISVPTPSSSPTTAAEETADVNASGFTMRRARLKAGQLAPSANDDDAVTTVLLCIYRAVGSQYYKYTIGGVNIMFVNLVPLVFFTIFDAFVLLPIAEGMDSPSKLFKLIASRIFIFILGLASVIPLSYFIGMAVASISAQSSIGMGAVINATFGSIIEIILYSIALTQGKGRLVEGSIVGSILAGVLLMPGASMVSGAFKRKEQRFNAKSAGVTSTMLIMAIIGTLTPTMFYQTYGSFQLRCEGCPEDTAGHQNSSLSSDVGWTVGTSEPWKCQRCYYDHPEPADDPFYQDQVKTLMYFCATILLLSYLIGLWFSLKTHASQIWQNPQQIMKNEDLNSSATLHPSHRATLYQRTTPQAVMQQLLPTHRNPEERDKSMTRAERGDGHYDPEYNRQGQRSSTCSPTRQTRDPNKRTAHFRTTPHMSSTPLQTPYMDGPPSKQPPPTPMQLPASLTTEDFTRAVAVATVSALRQHASAAHRLRSMPLLDAPLHEEAEDGGHESPSWSRGTSTAVLLSCTVLYALIAEVLVDVVDVVLDGSGIDEKFLGITLFALVPNTTEFMNAMSFALNGNIALSMEIGSAYALQVCLLQIPAMVAFSAFWDPDRLGEMVDTFTLIFPRWDVISIILAIFLLTYTYIEARSNYHRGSILILSYIVLTAGFYFAPPASTDGEEVVFPHPDNTTNFTVNAFQWLTGSSFSLPTH